MSREGDCVNSDHRFTSHSHNTRSMKELFIVKKVSFLALYMCHFFDSLMWFWCQKQFFNDGINISESEDSASFYRVEHKCTQPIYCALDKQATGGWRMHAFKCVEMCEWWCTGPGVSSPHIWWRAQDVGGPVTSDQVCSTWGLVLQKVPSEGS